jgi:ribonuclease HI
VDPLHPDFIERAPEDWFETRGLAARFRYDRPDLRALSPVSYDDLGRAIDLTMPLFIETDGACSGNPGPGGWGFIIAQGNMKIEAYGAEGHTTNNEMELRAIDEALGFFRNARGYVVLESDSEGCLATMTGRGDRWEADNYTRLDGSEVKNRELVQNITTNLKALNVQFRKVDGHGNDQWNDAVDALAVKGRDDAATWPRCSFDIVTPERLVAFRERAMRDDGSFGGVYAELRKETTEKLPAFLDTKLYKAGALYTGKWTSGHYQFMHKSLPAPLALSASRPAAPKIKPAIFGIWDGRRFKYTRPFDVTRISKEQVETIQ